MSSSEPDKSSADKPGSGKAIESAIRIGLLLVLVVWCFEIVHPFVMPVIWAGILAIALNPAYSRMTQRGMKPVLATSFIVLTGLAVILIPGGYIGKALVQSSANLVDVLQSGELTLPAPPQTVKQLPLVGEALHEKWVLAAKDMEQFLVAHAQEIIDFSFGVVGMAGAAVVGVLTFCFSLIISGVFLAHNLACAKGIKLLAVRTLGSRGEAMVDLAGDTVKSVVKGVLGVAVIQSALISVGFFAVGLSLAPVLSALVLVMAIAQLPSILVVLPVIVYVFDSEPTWIAVLFTLWSLFAGVSDNFLKPLLMGRGVDVPMLVILLGSLGGMLMSGFVGLFVGAVVLAVGWKLLEAWVEEA